MHLKEDGVMVVNMNMRGGGEGNINQYAIVGSYRHIFGKFEIPSCKLRDCPINLHTFDPDIGEGNINQYLADTIAQVFSCVYTADVPGTTNRELFASNCPNFRIRSVLPHIPKFPMLLP